MPLTPSRCDINEHLCQSANGQCMSLAKSHTGKLKRGRDEPDGLRASLNPRRPHSAPGSLCAHFSACQVPRHTSWFSHLHANSKWHKRSASRNEPDALGKDQPDSREHQRKTTTSLLSQSGHSSAKTFYSVLVRNCCVRPAKNRASTFAHARIHHKHTGRSHDHGTVTISRTITR